MLKSGAVLDGLPAHEVRTWERSFHRVAFSTVSALLLALALTCLTTQLGSRKAISSLAQSGDNLQYDLAFAKANFAADEVEIQNSIARLKEMDKIIHGQNQLDYKDKFDKLRQEYKVLLNKSLLYKADSNIAEMKLEKALEQHQPSDVKIAINLENEDRDDMMFSRILDNKGKAILAKLKESREMGLAMERYNSKEELLVGATKEIKHLESEKSKLRRDYLSLNTVMNKMAQRPHLTALPDDKVEAAEQEAMAIERLSRLKKHQGV